MLTLTTLLLAFCLVDTVKAGDTVLDDQFCQNYYNLNDGKCEEVRSTVRSTVRGRGTPTLEMGDSETQPAMVFFHGWPDTSAVWANQFVEFCSDQGGYFCVAPSWIDFHPDFPRADESELLWSNQVETFHAVVEDLGLANITLVIFDFGAILGFQYTYLYPNIVRRVIALDHGLDSGPAQQLSPIAFGSLPQYQQINIAAFWTDKEDLMMRNLERNFGSCPCYDCHIAPPPPGVTNVTGIGARTGWPYYNFIRTDHPWTSFFSVPLEEWEFNYIPSFPEGIPLLFLYRSTTFHGEYFLDWIDGREDGVSEHMRISGYDHWFNVRIPDAINSKILSWIIATEGDSDSTPLSYKNPDVASGGNFEHAGTAAPTENSIATVDDYSSAANDTPPNTLNQRGSTLRQLHLLSKDEIHIVVDNGKRKGKNEFRNVVDNMKRKGKSEIHNIVDNMKRKGNKFIHKVEGYAEKRKKKERKRAERKKERVKRDVNKTKERVKRSFHDAKSYTLFCVLAAPLMVLVIYRSKTSRKKRTSTPLSIYTKNNCIPEETHIEPLSTTNHLQYGSLDTGNLR